MLSESGGWIYTFAVTDTETHKDGYTIYKITSIVSDFYDNYLKFLNLLQYIKLLCVF